MKLDKKTKPMTKSLNILLIEDDAIEVMKFNRVIKKLALNHKIIEANNGEEALNILKIKEIIPDIIILDLNMPKMNGIEFLEHRQNYKTLKLIPTVVLTTSKDEQNKVESFNLGVAGYMIKPVDYMQFVEVIKTINLYWTLSELPNNSR